MADDPVLDRAEMIAIFEEQGYTAIPHPYVAGWIAMPLHHKVDAQHLADHHGWEWVPLGWKPKEKIYRVSLAGGRCSGKSGSIAG